MIVKITYFSIKISFEKSVIDLTHAVTSLQRTRILAQALKLLQEKVVRNNRNIYKKKAPDQNRTDTSSLEGYGSTIELQAQTRLRS